MRSGWGWGRVLVGASLVVLGGCAHAAATPPQDAAAAAPADSPDFGSTGATQTLHMSRKDMTRYATVEEFLQGRVAGLQVIPLGNGQFALRIRGTSSINMSQDPLVVIDGVQVPQEGISNALAGISPDQIRDVQVLKDGASTAFYGVRGSNGVILITTRRGNEKD